jgi:hypothetical protein
MLNLTCEHERSISKKRATEITTYEYHQDPLVNSLLWCDKCDFPQTSGSALPCWCGFASKGCGVFDSRKCTSVVSLHGRMTAALESSGWAKAFFSQIYQPQQVRQIHACQMADYIEKLRICSYEFSSLMSETKVTKVTKVTKKKCASIPQDSYSRLLRILCPRGSYARSKTRHPWSPAKSKMTTGDNSWLYLRHPSEFCCSFVHWIFRKGGFLWHHT